ncbi:flagellar hook assembly protein FlgD [Marinimicrobium sp. ABcell2]|nr:flagellar hook assembly protein FlgD [Marinimicrobium sp. ABcell2]MDQ2077336.1 flagellar hook assembly protein FlgD [Marinimicrobium sp. ABcell2]
MLSHLNITQKNQKEKTDNSLGQTAFLELMIAQMNHQDPLSPQDNTEFVAQLAQFSSVEGLERLNKNFEGFTNNFMSNQALQASSLVGTSVSVETDTTKLMEGGIVSGSALLESSTGGVAINIYNDKGSLVAQVPAGDQPRGEMVFRWDGQNMEVNGKLLKWRAEQPMPAGDYRFEVMGNQNGEQQQMQTALSANVNSVTMGADGKLTLNLAGIGAVNIADVKQFN